MTSAMHDPTLIEYVESERIAREYDGYHAGNPLFELDRVFLAEVLPESGLVVDIGCGTGRLLLDLMGKGHEAIGVDLSHHMLLAAREKAGKELALVRGDMLALPVADKKAHACIMMFSVLGMLRGKRLQEQALKEAHRILRPGGVLALHVHNRFKRVAWGTADIFKGFVLRLFGGQSAECMRNYRGLPQLYLHLFSRGEIRRLIDFCGFRLLREEAIRDDRSGFMAGCTRSWGADGFLLAAAREG
ncbi:MAG: class I SAM-dependent methyltransferase [Planctomycetes bacterium]|nr:class I SAM-dependent methyltransferase [Planctomycetota bacterium]